MADGRCRLEWNQSSIIMSLIYNANRGKDMQPMPPGDFNPYAGKQQKPAEPIMLPITVLKDIFLRT